MNNTKIKKMTGIAIFTALVVVLQLVANYVTIGQISINLALIPIVVGSILFGPYAGFFLGLVDGALILSAPSTLATFMPFNPVATIFLCLLKTSLAGLISGFIYKLLNKKQFVVAVILSSISVPIINTGIFALGTITFFMPLLKEFASGSNVYSYLFLTFIGINFVIEFLINSVLSPVVLQLIKIYKKSHNLSEDN